MNPIDWDMTVWGHLTIILLQLIGFYYQWKREERWHRWRQEEQRRASLPTRGRPADRDEDDDQDGIPLGR